MTGELAALAADAYVYGYPLAADVSAVDGFVRQGLGMTPAAPFNSFSHATRLAGPDDLDHLGPGTVDDPAWKLPDRGASYLPRALAARGGLWGNHAYEAVYAFAYTDADGDRLDGRGRYTLTFDTEPPADAFWSVTMYDLPDYYLVANPIGRYSIGDRTPGLRRAAGEPLTIEIQHDRPPDTSNWLPAPAAPFRPILRLYQPRASVLDGSYRIPPIRKAGRQSAS